MLQAPPGRGQDDDGPAPAARRGLAGGPAHRRARASPARRPGGGPPHGRPARRARGAHGGLSHPRRAAVGRRHPHRGRHRRDAHPPPPTRPDARRHRPRRVRRGPRAQPPHRPRPGARCSTPRPLRPDLRLLAMSATLDADRLAALLGGAGGPAPVVTSEGRAHPVEVRWAPAATGERPAARRRPGIVAEAVAARRAGDVLVFLAGAADIRRAGRRPARARAPPAGSTSVRCSARSPPPSRTPPSTASPPGRRRVVLATDIAETSLTVEACASSSTAARFGCPGSTCAPG